MYCPNCANEVKPDLHYCNSCGFRISGKAGGSPDPIAKTLASSLGYIGVFSIIGFVFLIKSLLDYGIQDGRLIVLAFLYLASTFGIVYFLLKRIGGNKTEPTDQVVSQPSSKPTLKPVDTNQLEAPKEPPASVTVNTTRTLDEVHLDRD